MKKLYVLSAGALVALGLLAAPAAQADTEPEHRNHGECVASSPKPEGKGGRSEVARSQECRDAKPDHGTDPEPDPMIDCTDAVENGTVDVDEDADEVTITGTGPNTAGSSLECDVDDLEVEAGETVVFTYELGDGTDPCGGGIPRIFVTIDGTNFNTFDGDPDCSEAAGNTVTYELPEGGELTHIVLVYDRGDLGSVTYSDVTIAGMGLDL